MPLPKFIANIVGGGASDLIKSIGNTVDKFVTTKEEKEQLNIELQKVVNEHTVKMAEIAKDEYLAELEVEKAQLADTANARDSNVKIQESDKASFLAKNIPYIIASLLTLVWSIVTIYLIAKSIKIVNDNADLTAVLSLYATITAVFMTVLNYYFGSSASSARKQQQIEKMQNK